MVRAFLLCLLAVAAGVSCKRTQRATDLAAPVQGTKVPPTTENDAQMPITRRNFSVRIDVKDCAYGVYLNGGPVSLHLSEVTHEEEVPVNHLVRTGGNVLEAIVLKTAGEVDDCVIALTFVIKGDSDAGSASTFVLAHSAAGQRRGLPTAGSSGADASVSVERLSGVHGVGPARWKKMESESAAGIYLLSRHFELETDFPEWRFFKGETLKPSWQTSVSEVERLHAEVLRAYKRVWSLLAKKDINGFLDACEERSREIDIAYYKAPGETRRRLKELLEAAINDPELELASIDLEPGKYWLYDVGTKGHLISLGSGNRGTSIIRYEQKGDVPFSQLFPVIFRKEGDKYIITR